MVVKPPYGAAVDELLQVQKYAEDSLAAVSNDRKFFNPKGADKIEESIKNTVGNTFREMREGRLEAIRGKIISALTNINSARAEWNRAKAGLGVIELSLEFKVIIKGEPVLVQIDCVEKGGLRWVEVKDWDSFKYGSSKWGELERQLTKILTATKDPRFLVNGQSPTLLVSFSKGVTPEVKAALEKMGVLVEDFSQGQVLP